MKLVFKNSYGDGSWGFVYQLDSGVYAVYEIPWGGGEEIYQGKFEPDQLDDAIAYSKTFT